MSFPYLILLTLILAISANQAQSQSSYSIATKGSPNGTPGSYFCSISSPSPGCQTWWGGANFSKVSSASFSLGLLYSNDDKSGSNYFDHWSFNPYDHSLTYYLSDQTPEPCSIQGYTTGKYMYTCPGGKVVVDVTVTYW